jgi:hypothetical protein
LENRCFWEKSFWEKLFWEKSFWEKSFWGKVVEPNKGGIMYNCRIGSTFRNVAPFVDVTGCQLKIKSVDFATNCKKITKILKIDRHLTKQRKQNDKMSSLSLLANFFFFFVIFGRNKGIG